MSETRARVKLNYPTRERRDAVGRRKNEGLQTKPKLLTPLEPLQGLEGLILTAAYRLSRGDFHARSRFVRSSVPEEKWGLLVV